MDAVAVVVDKEEAQVAQVPNQLFGEGECFADKAAHALAQGQVEALDMVCFSFFAARSVLLAGDDLLVRVPEVAVTG